MYNVQNVMPTLTEERLNCEIRLGGFNIVLKLSGYNGESDDESVRVDLYSSVGLGSRAPVPCGKNGDWQNLWDTSKWYAADHWLIMQESVVPSAEQAEDSYELPNSLSFSSDAFVREGYLVATFDKADLWLYGQRDIPGFHNKLTDVVAVGWLIRRNGRWQVEEATLGGRTSVEDMKDAFTELGLNFSNCPGGRYLTNSALEAAPDLATDSNACGALSMGLRFTAEQTLGGRIDRSPRPPRTWRYGLCYADAGAGAGDAQ
jgi:hypothetical protein